MPDPSPIGDPCPKAGSNLASYAACTIAPTPSRRNGRQQLPRKNLRLTAAAILTAAPLLLLGSGAAFAETTDAPLDLVEELEVPADNQEASQEESDVSAPVTEGATEEPEPAEGYVGGADDGSEDAALSAPEFDVIVESDPRRMFITNISVPGVEWSSLEACAAIVQWPGAGFFAGPLENPGPHEITPPADVSEIDVDLFCKTLTGTETPRTLKVVSLITEEDGMGSTGAGTGGGEISIGSGSGATGSAVVPAVSQLAATGGSSSAMIGISAAATAALGAGLLLARRFTKTARAR